MFHLDPSGGYWVLPEVEHSPGFSSQPSLAPALTEGGVHGSGNCCQAYWSLSFHHPSLALASRLNTVSSRLSHPLILTFLLMFLCQISSGLVLALACSLLVCKEVVIKCVANRYVDVDQNGCACLFACTYVRACTLYEGKWLSCGFPQASRREFRAHLDEVITLKSRYSTLDQVNLLHLLLTCRLACRSLASQTQQSWYHEENSHVALPLTKDSCRGCHRRHKEITVSSCSRSLTFKSVQLTIF